MLCSCVNHVSALVETSRSCSFFCPFNYLLKVCFDGGKLLEELFSRLHHFLSHLFILFVFNLLERVVNLLLVDLLSLMDHSYNFHLDNGKL